MAQRREYGQAVIDRLREADQTEPVRRAIEWLRANLTDAALAGCHHCGEGDSVAQPCWWCGLRDEPRHIKRSREEGRP